jgi:hypothetical protein
MQIVTPKEDYCLIYLVTSDSKRMEFFIQKKNVPIIMDAWPQFLDIVNKVRKQGGARGGWPEIFGSVPTDPQEKKEWLHTWDALLDALAEQILNR